MTDMTAAAQLQAWLDGTTSTLSKTAIRTVLWDLAEAQTQLEQSVASGVPTEVWYYTDDDEGSSSEVYLSVEDAKTACGTHYVAEYDPVDMAEAEFTWREITPRGGTLRWLLDHGGTFTGWSVDSVRVMAPTAKAGA
ncbi:hypothetical protein [Mycobacterium sp.]|uniref:hypothetical protein n=1 Tax=Mycobacterium sp. TaxID=1785 RepID=UPI002608CF14|nr:hypothetical protein [Mycobacterium sp.]